MVCTLSVLPFHSSSAWYSFVGYFGVFFSCVLPKQLLSKCMKAEVPVYSYDRCISFCNASLPFLKSDLPGLPQGLRITLLSWFDHLPLIRDHQYERGSLQQGHLSYNSINKTSYAIAFVPLQTSHNSLKECIPLCALETFYYLKIAVCGTSH